MKTTKSPRRVLQYAYLIGQLVLPDYSHRCSRHDFTQPQLFACLALKEFLQLDYRKLTGLLQDASELAAAIGLQKVPHFTTFQKAARRLLINRFSQAYLDQTVRLAQVQGRLPRRVSLAALDGTGLESRHVSQHYLRRSAATAKTGPKAAFRRFPKAGVLCDTQTHLVLACVPGRGPGSDGTHFEQALNEALRRVQIDTLAADAGYDGEHHHRFAREQKGVRSLIPPLIGRPTKKPPTGYWRRQMKSRLHLTRYSQRWQAETVNSMLKRLLGSALRARRYWSQCREILLRAITLNIMILRRRQGFYRASIAKYSHLRPLPTPNNSSIAVQGPQSRRGAQHELRAFEFAQPVFDDFGRQMMIGRDDAGRTGRPQQVGRHLAVFGHRAIAVGAHPLAILAQEYEHGHACPAAHLERRGKIGVRIAVEITHLDLVGRLGKVLEDGALLHAIAAPGPRQAQDLHLADESGEQRALLLRERHAPVERLPAFAMLVRAMLGEKVVIGEPRVEHRCKIHVG
ncbi:MAG: IS5 family transposase [Pirellulales bacterium]|nr:IS5 family transposase [Pirellulales bacterium]